MFKKTLGNLDLSSSCISGESRDAISDSEDPTGERVKELFANPLAGLKMGRHMSMNPILQNLGKQLSTNLKPLIDDTDVKKEVKFDK